MQTALKIPITIPENHKIELTFPEELPPGPAELIVLTTPRERLVKRSLRPIGLDAGQGWVADDFDAPLPEEVRRLFEGDP